MNLQARRCGSWFGTSTGVRPTDCFPWVVLWPVGWFVVRTPCCGDPYNGCDVSLPEEFAREIRVAAAVKGHEQQRISQGRAAEVTCLCRHAILDALNRFGVSPFLESLDGLREQANGAA